MVQLPVTYTASRKKMLMLLGISLVFVAIGVWQRFGIYYYLGVHVAAFLAAWHYVMIRDRSRERCFKAFLHNNWIGAAVFAGIAADQWR